MEGQNKSLDELTKRDERRDYEEKVKAQARRMAVFATSDGK